MCTTLTKDFQLTVVSFGPFNCSLIIHKENTKEMNVGECLEYIFDKGMAELLAQFSHLKRQDF